MQPRPLSAVGSDALDALDPRPGERVLDLGAGAARTTVALAGRVGARNVVVVPGDPARAAALGQDLPGEVDVDRQTLEAFVLREPVDAVLSVGVLHLVADLRAVLVRAAAAMRPGGRLVATCAGAGNVADARTALTATLAAPPWSGVRPAAVDPWAQEPDASVLAAALEAADLVDVGCERQEAVVVPDDMHAHLRATVLGAHLDRLPSEAHGPFVDAVLERMEEPDRLRHVRLDATARRSEDAPPPGLLPGEDAHALRRRLGGG